MTLTGGPHLSAAGREGAWARAAWADLGRARGRERREEIGPDSAQRPRRGLFELF